MQTYKYGVGDLVSYKTRDSSIGKITCKQTGTWGRRYGVQWLKGPGSGASWAYESNLILLDRPSPEEIQKALDTLNRAGKVEFTPTKPLFEPREVKISSSYTAIINDQEVVVGCTHIPFSTVKEIALAVKAAQEYNKS